MSVCAHPRAHSQGALSNLSLVIHLTKHIRVRADKNLTKHTHTHTHIYTLTGCPVQPLPCNPSHQTHTGSRQRKFNQKHTNTHIYTFTHSQGALSNLSLVVHLTKHIRVRAGEKDSCEDEGYGEIFPSLLWVVRDFALQLVGTGGEVITPREYLERSLQMTQGTSQQVCV